MIGQANIPAHTHQLMESRFDTRDNPCIIKFDNYLERNPYKQSIHIIKNRKHEIELCKCHAAKFDSTTCYPLGNQNEILSNTIIEIPNKIAFVYVNKEKLSHLIATSTIRKTLYFIFELLEINLIEKKYDLCNEFLNVCIDDIEKFDVNILVGFLTATLPWRNNLPYRKDFFEKTKQKINFQYDEEEANLILVGLE